MTSSEKIAQFSTLTYNAFSHYWSGEIDLYGKCTLRVELWEPCEGLVNTAFAER